VASREGRKIDVGLIYFFSKRGNAKLKFIGVQGKQEPTTPPTNLLSRVPELFTILL